MTQLSVRLHPAAAQSLELWHTMIASRDLGNLSTIVHQEAVFRSPIAFKAYAPAPALILALTTVIQVFEDFAYHRQLVSEDGLNVVLRVQRPRGREGAEGYRSHPL